MILFRDKGPMLFRDAIEKALCDPASQRKWYLSGIDDLARKLPVWTCSISGLQWCEVDYRADLKQAEKVITACGACPQAEIGDDDCQITEVILANP
jgi:hypothetical protein